MGSRILVTGGAGYIGSHIVKQLGEAGHEIIIVDNLSTGRKESVLYGELIEKDIADGAFLDSLMKDKKFDACLHFAGSIIVPESVEKPHLYYQNNAMNSLNLVHLCSENNIDNFIFSSTAAVYGIPESGECRENTLANPINPYGRSKLMTEWTLEDISFATDLNFVALRYFNVAGGNVDGKLGQCSPFSTHLIKIACEVACGKRDKMTLFGSDYETPDGTCVRDYIHIDDLARAHLDALNYLLNGGSSTILNCGYGHGTSVAEVIKVVKNVTGVDIKVEKGDRRAGDAPSLIAIADKIKDVIGWEPQYDDLELIVKTAYEWERNLK